MQSIVERWNHAYFGGRLSPEVLAALRPLENASGEAHAFVVPGLLPGAWDGAVPPITTAGRHRKLDDYVAANPWHRPGNHPVLLGAHSDRRGERIGPASGVLVVGAIALINSVGNLGGLVWPNPAHASPPRLRPGLETPAVRESSAAGRRTVPGPIRSDR